MSVCVQMVLPKEEPFTVADIVAGLEGLDPGRIWRRKSVYTYIGKLTAGGLLRRLDRHRGRESSLYVPRG